MLPPVVSFTLRSVTDPFFFQSVLQAEVRQDGLPHVDVWVAELSPWTGNALAFQNFLSFLSSAERARAQKLGSDALRQRFILCRGLLRAVLGHQLGMDPGDVQIEIHALGKPQLVRVQVGTGPRLEFNLSHSQDRVALAVCSGHAVGIDIEQVRHVDYLALANKVYSPGEIAALAALSSSVAQQEAFFQTWVRKEALLKGLGTGLSYAALRESDVRAEFLLPGWSLIELEVGPGYRAALAVQS